MAPNLKRRVLGAFLTILVVVITLPVILDKTRHMDALPSDVPPMPEIPEWAEVKNEQRVRVELTDLASGEAAKALEPKQRKVVTEDTAPIETIAANDAGMDENQVAVAWVLQLGAFNERAKANALRDELRSKNYKAFTDEFSDEGLVRVYVGPELQRDKIAELQIKLSRELGQDDIFIKRWVPSL